MSFAALNPGPQTAATVSLPLSTTPRRTMALPPSPDLIVESEQTVWNGRFRLEVIKFRHRRFDGSFSGTRTWEMLCRGKAAAVLPYDPVADRVVMIEQFRLPAYAAGLKPVMTELAAGLVDAGETPEDTITREAREEMGLDVDLLEKIGDFLLTPGGCDELCTLFAGRVRLGEIGPDDMIGTFGLASENEDILVRALPAALVIENALNGVYQNSVAAIGVLWFALRRDYLRAKWLAG